MIFSAIVEKFAGMPAPGRGDRGGDGGSAWPDHAGKRPRGPA